MDVLIHTRKFYLLWLSVYSHVFHSISDMFSGRYEYIHGYHRISLADYVRVGIYTILFNHVSLYSYVEFRPMAYAQVKMDLHIISLNIVN